DQLGALVEPRGRQQQAGDELGRGGGGNLDAAAPQRTGAVDGERQSVPGDGGAQRTQGVEHGGLRADPGGGVAVEGGPAGGQGGNRRDEAHHGPRQAALDVGAPQLTGGDDEIGVVRVERSGRALDA